MSVYPMNVFVSERTYERASHRAKTASTNDVKNKYEKTDETKSMHKFGEFFFINSNDCLFIKSIEIFDEFMKTSRHSKSNQ